VRQADVAMKVRRAVTVDVSVDILNPPGIGVRKRLAL
jgi:hypothetical protein